VEEGQRQKYWLVPLIVLSVVIFDQLTKYAVAHNLEMGVPVSVLGSWVRFTYVENPNAAFGIPLCSRGGVLIPLVILVTFFVVILLLRSRSLFELVGLSLILGGAIGNLLDRIRTGRVVDFIDIGIGPHRWPYFNIADSAVTVGVIMLAVVWLLIGTSRSKGEDAG